MYADLFDQLGRSRNAAANATVETPPIVAFKAGVMKLEPSQLTGDIHDTSNSNPAAFTCTADTATRGQIRLIRSPTNADELKWQLYDRRRDTVVETEIIVPGTTFTKVERGGLNAKTNDRIYVWTRPASTPMYKMYWLQDADDTDDDDIVKTVNETLQSAKVIVTTTTSSTGTRTSSSRGAGATAGSGGSTNADPQVDTLSSLLENLGMPAPAAAGTSAGGSGSGGTTSNQLTLADLQGAMASIQQQQQEQQAQQQVDLTDIITTEAITDLLDHNEAAVQRLLPFLPESQQTIEHLRDNLLSPSVRRSLALLSQALQDGDSYGSVIANFQLDPNAGQDALIRGNPVAAFLDCVTASVAAAAQQEDEEGGEKEEAAEGDESKDEESKDDDAAVDES
jgi:UCH-binding domain